LLITKIVLLVANDHLPLQETLTPFIESSSTSAFASKLIAPKTADTVKLAISDALLHCVTPIVGVAEGGVGF